MATRINQDDHVKTALRLPPALHARIHESAAATGRSYNAELIARLDASFLEAADDHGVLRLLKGNDVLLKTLARFVVMRFKGQTFPEMDEAILQLANAVLEVAPGGDAMAAAEAPFLQYIEAMVAILNKATDAMGLGWGRPENLEKVRAVAQQAVQDGSMLVIERDEAGKFKDVTTTNRKLPHDRFLLADPREIARMVPLGDSMTLADAGGRNRTGTGDFESPTPAVAEPPQRRRAKNGKMMTPGPAPISTVTLPLIGTVLEKPAPAPGQDVGSTHRPAKPPESPKRRMKFPKK